MDPQTQWLLGQSATVIVLVLAIKFLATRQQGSIDNNGKEIRELRISIDRLARADLALIASIPDIPHRIRKVSADIESELDTQKRLDENSNSGR